MARITFTLHAYLLPEERFRVTTVSDYGLQPLTLEVHEVTMGLTGAKVSGLRVVNSGATGRAWVQGTEPITQAFLDLLPADLRGAYEKVTS